MGKDLGAMGWSEDSIEGVVDSVGVEQCLQMLERKGMFLSSDVCICASRAICPMSGKST